MINMNSKKLVAVSIICFSALYLISYSTLSFFIDSTIALLIVSLLFSAAASYSLMFFLLSRFLIPNLGFTKSKMPKKLPKNISLVIRHLMKKSRSKYEYLKSVYNYLTTKYHGKRNTILKNPDLLFNKNLNNIWAKKGFLPCHTFNYLTRLLLVKSRIFNDHEIKIKHSFLNFSIHQYMEIKVKNKWLKLDPWAHGIGIKFGDYARFFR